MHINIVRFTYTYNMLVVLGKSDVCEEDAQAGVLELPVELGVCHHKAKGGECQDQTHSPPRKPHSILQLEDFWVNSFIISQNNIIRVSRTNCLIIEKIIMVF